MKNKTSEKIIDLVSNLAYFNLVDLDVVKIDKEYLKIMLSRYIKKGEIIKLKKGMYTSKNYLEKVKRENIFSDYSELIANILYKPSYISLEYVLSENNILTESPKNFTSISLNKTANFSNFFGNFFYHSIRKDLYIGFNIIKKENFLIAKASKAKALFDFLYLRKNILLTPDSIKELRLNLDDFNSKDKAELKKYITIEKSLKLKDIYRMLF